jgi:hypothetical protein
MAHREINLSDEGSTEDTIPSAPNLRRPYRVLAEAGLFKNGVQYDQGSEIELDPRTGGNFVAAGDVEEIEEGLL